MWSHIGAVTQAFCKPYSFVPPRSVGALVTLHYVGTVSALQARPGMTKDGSGNKAENYSSISATNQHQLRQKMYQ